MRTVTFNIQHGVAGLDRVAALLQALAPEVAFLQEVDRGCARSGRVDQAASLAQALGMHFVFEEAFPFEGGSYGLALLTRGAMGPARRVALPHPSPLHADGRGEPRILLHAPYGGRLLACTHLGLSQAERGPQARAIRHALEERPDVLLGGDLNEGSNGDVLAAWNGWLVDAFHEAGGAESESSPADRPRTRIDFVLRGSEVAPAVHAFVGPAGVSDHRPVIVDFG